MDNPATADAHSGDRLPFSRAGGDLSVDFTNTVSWTSDGLRQERLRSYRDVVEWAGESGLVANARPLLRAAARDRRAAAATLNAALELRRVLHALFAARASARRPPSVLVTALGCCAVEAAAHRRLTGGAAGLRWEWTDDRDLAAPLRRVALAAAHLLTGDDATRIRLCGNPECGWVFVDRSRRGNRRWCEMAACGSRDKARRYYRRRRAAGVVDP